MLEGNRKALTTEDTEITEVAQREQTLSDLLCGPLCSLWLKLFMRLLVKYPEGVKVR